MWALPVDLKLEADQKFETSAISLMQWFSNCGARPSGGAQWYYRWGAGGYA